MAFEDGHVLIAFPRSCSIVELNGPIGRRTPGFSPSPIGKHHGIDRPASSIQKWWNPLRSRRPSRLHRGRRPILGMESLETRLCLSATATGSAPPVGSGVDSIAIGDVNGSQLVDVAVASHQNGTYEVTIYSGIGEADSSLTTKYAAYVLATIPDPFSVADGPLDLAMGDFDNGGISDLAISSRYSNEIAVYSFSTGLAKTVSPINATVTANSMVNTPTGLFVPAGLSDAHGINLAAVDTNGDGIYQLVATPATGGPGELVVLSYNVQTGDWNAEQTIGDIPVDTSDGLSVSAGDISGSGSADIVVGSQADGRVAAYDMGLQRWVWKVSPLGDDVQNINVSVDTSEGQGASGSIFVTGVSSGTSKAAIVPWEGTAGTFTLKSSPGSGELVPLGAGYVYRPSTIKPKKGKVFSYSKGPATPVGLFASTNGDQLVIQQFEPRSSKSLSNASFKPSKKDAWVEPLWGNPGNGFYPMMVESDPDATGTSNASSTSKVPSIDLVVLPYNEYNSPYSIDLSNVPSFVTAGLLNLSSVTSTTNDAWGPAAAECAADDHQRDHRVRFASSGDRRLCELFERGSRLPASLQRALGAQPDE